MAKELSRTGQVQLKLTSKQLQIAQTHQAGSPKILWLLVLTDNDSIHFVEPSANLSAPKMKTQSVPPKLNSQQPFAAQGTFLCWNQSMYMLKEHFSAEILYFILSCLQREKTVRVSALSVWRQTSTRHEAYVKFLNSVSCSVFPLLETQFHVTCWGTSYLPPSD